jgi:hypothetical protein
MIFLMTHLPQITVNHMLAIPAPKLWDRPNSNGCSDTNTQHFITVQSV